MTPITFELTHEPQAEESARVAYDAAADLCHLIIDRLPEDRFRNIDQQMRAGTGEVVVTLNLSTRTVKVGMASAGTAVPDELLDLARASIEGRVAR